MLMHCPGISVCVQLTPHPLIVLWHSRKVLDHEICDIVGSSASHL